MKIKSVAVPVFAVKLVYPWHHTFTHHTFSRTTSTMRVACTLADIDVTLRQTFQALGRQQWTQLLFLAMFNRFQPCHSFFTCHELQTASLVYRKCSPIDVTSNDNTSMGSATIPKLALLWFSTINWSDVSAAVVDVAPAQTCIKYFYASAMFSLIIMCHFLHSLSSTVQALCPFCQCSRLQLKSVL